MGCVARREWIHEPDGAIGIGKGAWRRHRGRQRREAAGQHGASVHGISSEAFARAGATLDRDKSCIETPLIPAKAGIQEQLGPRFRGDERSFLCAMLRSACEWIGSEDGPELTFTSWPRSSRATPVSPRA